MLTRPNIESKMPSEIAYECLKRPRMASEMDVGSILNIPKLSRVFDRSDRKKRFDVEQLQCH